MNTIIGECIVLDGLNPHLFVSAPECRDIETALYDRPYVRTSVGSYVRTSLAICVQYFIRYKVVVARAAAKRKQRTQK